MSAEEHMGVFKPFTMRMARFRQEAMIRSFMDHGEFSSLTGTTARIVINHCLEQGFPFSVEYRVDPGPHYIVRLTGAETVSRR